MQPNIDSALSIPPLSLHPQSQLSNLVKLLMFGCNEESPPPLQIRAQSQSDAMQIALMLAEISLELLLGTESLFDGVGQQQCKNWMRVLWAEQKAKDAKQKRWIVPYTTMFPNPNTSELTMSMMEKVSSTPQIRPFQKCPWQEDITAICAPKNDNPAASTIYVKRLIGEEQVKNSLFDMKAIEKKTVLYSFKCKPWPDIEETGLDSIKDEKNSLDQSQPEAHCAVPNPGKTMLLVRHLQQLKENVHDSTHWIGEDEKDSLDHSQAKTLSVMSNPTRLIVA